MMQLQVDPEGTRQLIREVVGQVLAEINWPVGRVALDEAEAAAACGVSRHVLRDLRLAKRIAATRLGRRIVYTRAQLVDGLAKFAEPGPPDIHQDESHRRRANGHQRIER
jgi:hypothetical protein